MLNRVTITGADESVSPGRLFDISRRFPFVEWGILASMSRTFSRTPSPRFPRVSWFEQLCVASVGRWYSLSLHLCGYWVRELLLGNDLVPKRLRASDIFQRVQLNFHGEMRDCRSDNFAAAVYDWYPQSVICQIDGGFGEEHFNCLRKRGLRVVPLFDLSHGAGVSPESWPAPLGSDETPQLYHGYAGGLGPDNLEVELPKILQVAGNRRVWVDMETKARSDNDGVFDLDKVVRCLEIAEPFIAA